MSDKASRLDELTRLGRVEVRSFPTVPASYGWPTCCCCGCVTPQATATAGLAAGEWLCPDCASHLKGWAARRIMAAARAHAMREAGARMAAANVCTCGGDLGLRPNDTDPCEVCRGWEEQLAALQAAQDRRLAE